MSFEPKIVGFLCNWCSYTGADLAGTSRIQYPPNINIIRVMCSARVEPDFVLRALAGGGRRAHLWLPSRRLSLLGGQLQGNAAVPVAQDAAEGYGVDNDRVRLEWVSASEGQRFADIVTDMTERVRALGPLRLKTDLQTDRVER